MGGSCSSFHSKVNGIPGSATDKVSKTPIANIGDIRTLILLVHVLVVIHLLVFIIDFIYN